VAIDIALDIFYMINYCSLNKKIILVILATFFLFTDLFAKTPQLSGKIAYNWRYANSIEIIYLDKVETLEKARNILIPKDYNQNVDSLSWFPDGENILIDLCDKRNSLPEPGQIASVNINSGEIKYLTEPSIDLIPDGYRKHFKNPCISPNGRYLGFKLFNKESLSRYMPGIYDFKENMLKISYQSHDIYHLEKNKHLTIITDSPSASSRLSWSLDSRSFVYENNETGIAAIVVYSVESNTTKKIRNGYNPIYHPTNGKIYYSENTTDRSYKKLCTFDVSEDKVEVIPITVKPIMHFMNLSKDGRYLFFIGKCPGFIPHLVDGPVGLYVYDIKTRKTHFIKNGHSGYEYYYY
jgi:Tol biopolymer transport system component